MPGKKTRKSSPSAKQCSSGTSIPPTDPHTTCVKCLGTRPRGLGTLNRCGPPALQHSLRALKDRKAFFHRKSSPLDSLGDGDDDASEKDRSHAPPSRPADRRSATNVLSRWEGIPRRRRERCLRVQSQRSGLPSRSWGQREHQVRHPLAPSQTRKKPILKRSFMRLTCWSWSG